jgi:hypothetical protein
MDEIESYSGLGHTAEFELPWSLLYYAIWRVFAGSQPTLMEEMLSAKRPFHKAGPKMFLDKISSTVWRDFIAGHFGKRGRTIEPQALELLLTSADLIPV